MTSLTSSLSRKLNLLMKKYNCSAAELSRKTSVPPQTLNRLLNAKTDDPRAATLQSIASYFGVSIDYLIGAKEGSSFATASPSKSSNNIPYYDVNPVKYLINQEEAQEWLAVDGNINSESSFAVLNKGHAMFPRFLDGAILVVDGVKEPKNKDFVYIYSFNQGECICRQWIIEGNDVCLMPINIGFSPVRFDHESYKILGVIVQMKSFL